MTFEHGHDKKSENKEQGEKTMMGKGRLILTAVAAISVLYLVQLVVTYSRFTGIYVDHEPVLADQCDQSFRLGGAEDLASIPGEGIFISATDRADRVEGFVDGIYWLANDGQPILVSRDAPSTFHPHGIDLFEGPDGYLLYVVSHDGELYGTSDEDMGHSIEVFHVNDDRTLTHSKSIRDKLIRSPNDITVMDVDRFYYTNDWRYLRGLGNMLEANLLLALSDVGFHDQGSTSLVAKGLNYPNGIALSEDQTTLWVNEIRGRRIQQFGVSSEDGSLKKQKRIPVATAPDNITVKPDGHLLVAGISDVFAFQAHEHKESEIAPSLILEVDPESGERRDAFYDVSGSVSGATVGLYHDEALYIGTAYGDTLLRCPYSSGQDGS
ncbi:MAG: SMP-30/gluconolactonase/LRE family protein [Pseudomonadota bacterium]